MSEFEFKVGDVIEKRYGTIRYIGYVTCVEHGFIDCITMAISRNHLLSLSMSNTYRIDDPDNDIVLLKFEPSAPTEQPKLITEVDLEKLRQSVVDPEQPVENPDAPHLVESKGDKDIANS